MKESSVFERVGKWLLALAVALAALAAGTVHTVTLCAVTTLLAIATGLSWWSAERTNVRPRLAATILLVTGIFLTAYTALQTVPMPIGWLAHIAPRNADVWARALTPLHGAAPHWAPISLDPTATRVEVLKGIAYLLAFVTALRIARTRDGTAFLSTTIVVIGAVVAAAALLHPAFGSRKLYGVWGPSAEVLVYEKHLAPFLNPNNLAAYLNVAFCLSLAATIAPSPRWPRSLVAAATILLASTQVWVASRGGVATMLLGTALVIVIARAHRLTQPKQRNAGAVSLIAGLAIAAGVLVVVLATAKQSADELFDTDLSKFRLVRQAVRMIPAFPIFGTGRGAFESTFPAFSETPGVWTFTHPENVVAQWLIEWGVPVGLGGLAAIVFGLRPSTVLARSSTASGAWAGIVAVAVQNLVDLGSETPGLVLAPVVCAAIVVGGTAGRSTRWRIERWGHSPRALALTAGLAGVLGIGSAAAGIGGELREDRSALHDAAIDTRMGVGPIHALAGAAMQRHPAEPYLPLIVGWRATRAGDDEPMPWIEAALERNREEGVAHLLLARLLTRHSPSQARMEYRLAFEQGPELYTAAAAETTRLISGYYDATELVSEGKTGIYTLQTLVDALPARLPATAARLDEQLATRAPADPGPALRSARNAIADLEGESAPWCEGAGRRACVTRALEASANARRVAPDTCEPHLLHAKARIIDARPREALSEFADAANKVTDRVPCLEALVKIADDAHDDGRVADAMTKIAATGCVDDSECATNLAWVAAAEERRGDGRMALAFYKRANERAPENDATLAAVARLAASAGLHAEAERDYERLARKHPDEPAWHKAADEQHGAALKAAAGL